MKRPQNENIKPHEFKPGQSGNLNGRPKKMINKLAELVGKDFNIELTKQDKYQLIENMLEKNIGELKEIASDKKSPVFMVSIALAILGDMQKKQINTVETIFNRVFGKPVQGHEVKADINLVVDPVLARKKLFDALKRKKD